MPVRYEEVTVQRQLTLHGRLLSCIVVKIRRQQYINYMGRVERYPKLV